MEQQAKGVVPAKWDQWEGKPGGGHAAFAKVLLALAAVFALAGMYVAFTYDETARLVGGDAYNLQIIASRGLVWMGGAAVLAIAAVAHSVFAVRAAVLATLTARVSTDGTIRWTERNKELAEPSAGTLKEQQEAAWRARNNVQ